MQASPGYQPTASRSDAEPTILTTAHQLRTSLNAVFNHRPTGSSSHLLHPLGPYDSAARPEQLAQISSTISSIRSAVTASSSLLPPPSDNPAGAPRAVGGPTDKLLSLLKETATSETVLLNSLQSDAQKARQLLARRDEYAGAYPVLTARQLSKLPEGSARGDRSLEVLEGFAASLGLVSFRDTASSTVDGLSKELHTLSLGGKVMVVDVEVESAGRVVRVKVSYVLEVQHEMEGAARKLEQMLSGLGELSADGDEVSLERGLKGFRETLRELRRLDEMTEQTGLDCFAMHDSMLSAIQKAFSSESTSFDAGSPLHGLLLPLTHSNTATILWHATPLSRLTDEWSSFAESSFAAGDALDEVLALEGVGTCRISLSKPSKGVAPVPNYNEPGNPSTSPTFVAHFIPGVPVTKATGRRIMAVLEQQAGTSSAAFAGESTSKAGTTWLEDLLISPRNGAVTKYDSDDVYRVTFDDLAFSQDYSIAEPATLPGYLVTDVRFRHPSELLKVIEILKEQQTLNDLVKSTLSPEHLVPASMSNKRRKLAQPVPSLEALFAATPSPALPIFIHLSSSSLSLSFPTPNVPVTSASPMSIRVNVSDGFSVSVEGRGSEKVSLEKVLSSSLDLALAVRSLSKQLG